MAPVPERECAATQTESVILSAPWSECRWIAPKSGGGNMPFLLPFSANIFRGFSHIFEKIPNYFLNFLKKSPRPDRFFFDLKSKN
jgi:hypothetical protein